MARPQHRRITTRRKILRGLATLTALSVVGAGVTGAVLYRNLDNNITAIDTTAALGTDCPEPAPVAPQQHHKPLNILLIGSDDRTGTRIGGETPGLSDTTNLVHTNAERTALTGVSIPRDSMVARPDCLAPNGKVAGEFAMFNTAYAIGGPGCTQRTVEQLTGVRTDHFVVVDLAGFTKMVDAIGGVPICVPQEVNDTIGNIYLPAGTYNATGAQALGYVRERHTLSANGDLGRMERQQAFLSAMATKVLSAGTLTNPRRLYTFLDAATASLTTDPDLASLGALASLAGEMSDLSPRNIRFLSVPTQPYAPDPNRLAWTSEAEKIWSAFRNDGSLPALLRQQTTTAPKTTATGVKDQRVRTSDDNGLCT